MKIIIPTYMRETKQKCWESMPASIREKTHLMSHSGRAEILKQNYPEANVHDMGVTNGIADVRQKALDFFKDDEKVLMLDDNVQFYWLDKADMKYKNMDEAAWIRLYDMINEKLDTYAQVSVSDKGLGGFVKGKSEGRWNTRIYSVNGLNRTLLKKAGSDFDTLWKMDPSCHLGEDFYLTLKLLVEGYQNWVSSDFAFIHPHGKPGGNSTTRSGEMEERSFQLLDELFPGIISYWKDYEATWKAGSDENGAYRWRCTIRWAKAYKQGLEKISKSEAKCETV